MQNIKIVHSDFIITSNSSFEIIENGAIVYDKQILDIGTVDNIKNRYKDIDVIYQGKNSVIIPGLINSHIHLEFSKNKNTLEYGNFIKWLNSVMANREDLIEGLNDDFLDVILSEILANGTTSIGAISSYGMDISACKKSLLRTVLFNEVIGSQAAMCDMLFDDFTQRLNQTIGLKDTRFTPAVAIHSPYSVHPILINRALQKAKDNNLAVSAHFMESSEEKEWLEQSSGDFKDFFEKFLNQSNSLQKPEEFLTLFNSINTSFVHSIFASQEHLETIKDKNHTLITCPVSNRLLTNSKLDVKKVIDLGIDLAIGTDGLSSNFSLNMFDELRNALMSHTEQNPNDFAKKLIKMATINGAKALKLNSGVLSKDKDADFLVIQSFDNLRVEDIALMIILHTKKENIKKVFILGEEI
jgi:cytosine/adenosine deaminase-related metal-dependent hydrolase